MAAEQNSAGPSSAKPERQQGLKETQQLPEKIIKGARQDDQLLQIKDNTKIPVPDNETEDSAREED
jgi:hypothetical protein